MRNMTPISQALAVISVTSALCGYEALAVAVAVVVFGVETVVTLALAAEDDESQR